MESWVFTVKPMQYHSSHLAQTALFTGIGGAIGHAMIRRSRQIANPSKSRLKAQPLRVSEHATLVAAAGHALTKYVMRSLHDGAIEQIESAPGTTTLRVLGVLNYVVDRRRRVAYSDTVPAHQLPLFAPWCWLESETGSWTNIDLLNPLCRPAWLQNVVTSGLWLELTNPELARLLPVVLPWKETAQTFMNKVMAWAHRALWREPRFHQMRACLAEQITLAVGTQVVELAMRARLTVNSGTLIARHLNLIWSHFELFTEVQRENPRLLRTATAWMQDCRTDYLQSVNHALAAMHSSLRAHELPPKAWRYLASHGIENLLSDLRYAPWEGLMDHLSLLDRMGWPPAPPVRMLVLLHDVVGTPDTDSTDNHASAAWFWKVVCTEAARIKADTSAYAALCDAVPLWAWALRKSGKQPDKNQQRHGIRWLMRNAAAMKPMFEQTGAEWSLWTRDVCWPRLGKLCVVPITNTRLLLEEAIALKNCAESYEHQCRQGIYLMLSLREQEGGKRRALVGLALHSGRWRFDNVAGPCNQRVNDPVRFFAQHLADVVNRHCAARGAP